LFHENDADTIITIDLDDNMGDIAYDNWRIKPDFSRRRSYQASDSSECRSLASAICTDESDDFTFPDVDDTSSRACTLSRQRLLERTCIPVIDGVGTAVKLVEALVGLGLRTNGAI
jgi:hypothetical protein